VVRGGGAHPQGLRHCGREHGRAIPLGDIGRQRTSPIQ
jgi:hypothetical protein